MKEREAMSDRFDDLLKTFEEYTDARASGDVSKTGEAKDALRSALSAFVVETVRADYRSNGALRELLREDLAPPIFEREIREGRISEPA